MATKKLTKAQLSAKLIEIVTATNSGGFVYTSAAEHGPLVTDGLVEVNGTMLDAAGNAATRATPKGVETVAGSSNSAAVAASKPTFSLETAKLPPAKPRGRAAGSEMYPFDQMEIGQSFFVPATTDKPEPAKSLGSTVSSANKRYAEVIPGEMKTVKVKGKDGQPDTTKEVPKTKLTRQFVVRARTAAEEAAENFTHGKDGARVYRVA